MLMAFEHRLRGDGYAQALKDLNDVDTYLLTWGHFDRLVKMRTRLEPDEVGDRLTEVERGQNLGRLGVTYLFMAHPEKADSFLAAAETIAKDCGDSENEGLWQIYRAWNKNDAGARDEAETLLKSAKRKVATKADKAFCAAHFGWLHQGLLGYHDVMQATEMLQSFDEAVRLYDSIPAGERDPMLRAYRATLAYMGRARSYAVLGQHDAANHDFKAAYDELRAIDHQRMLAVWGTNKGSAEREMGKLAQAKSTLEHALRLSIAIGDRRGEQVANSLLGKVHRDGAWAIRIKNDAFTEESVELLQASAHHFERAIKGERKLGNKLRLVIALRRLANVNRELSRALTDLKQDEAAIRVSRQAEEGYLEAGKVAPADDARTTIYDWLERTRSASAMPNSARGSFPGAQVPSNAEKQLENENKPLVVPPVETEIGIVLLRQKDAYKFEGHQLDSPATAFRAAIGKLEKELNKLKQKEKKLDETARDLKRAAELNYALGTALVGLAVSDGKGKTDENSKKARKILERTLNDFPSPGFIRDTYEDLAAMQGAIEKPKLIDEFLSLFRKKWPPEML
ncbi:MAG: hypothetical protein QNJ30_12365 [Kiloniellales bacterium]|nr:hypothetical protein [Kiloniellales bacterium]